MQNTVSGDVRDGRKQAGQVRRRRDTGEYIALYIKAFNAWHDNEPLTQLRFTSREEMPRITKCPLKPDGQTSHPAAIVTLVMSPAPTGLLRLAAALMFRRIAHDLPGSENDVGVAPCGWATLAVWDGVNSIGCAGSLSPCPR